MILVIALHLKARQDFFAGLAGEFRSMISRKKWQVGGASREAEEIIDGEAASWRQVVSTI